MSCPTSIDSTEREVSKLFTNWARKLTFRSQTAYKPTTRGEVVELINQAELDPINRIKWSGSLWSFMRTSETHDVHIESDQIFGLVEIEAEDIEDDQKKFLTHLSLSDQAAELYRNNQLVHIKGGTKIFNANRLLHGYKLLDNVVNHITPESEDEPTEEFQKMAFSTLGGSGGQAIAGAISTGTHGGDINYQPVGDYIGAIHLIGPGGQEWWIERTEGITRGTEVATEREFRRLIERIPEAEVEMCRDIKVKKDDDFFNAVLVSVGRMGFIYSLVMFVEPAFKLTEERSEDFWQDWRRNLHGRGLLNLTNSEGRRLHYLNIVIMPFANDANLNVCKLGMRVKHTAEEEEDLLPSTDPPGESNPITILLCRLSDARVLIPVLLMVLGLLGGLAAGLGASIGALLSIPFVGPILAVAVIAALAAVTAAMVTVTGLLGYLTVGGRMTVRELIGAISDIGTRLGLGDLVNTVLTALFNAAYPVEVDGVPYTWTDYSWKIMDTYPYGPDSFCEKVDSMEFAFDHPVRGTSAPDYYDFIDDVLALFEDLKSRNIAVAGNLAVRYSAPTTSMLGMSKYNRTCHIEIAALRDFPGSTEFVRRVQQLAKTHNAIPSWGQLFDGYNGADIRDLHIRLPEWRQVLSTLIREGGGNDFTFSNNFTQTYNLEPWVDGELVSLTVEITIGNDHLGDTAWPFRNNISQDYLNLLLTSGLIADIPLNFEDGDWQTWLAHTTHSRTIDLPSSTLRSDLVSLRINHEAAGPNLGTDNWTMNGIVITVETSSGGTIEILRLNGNPIFQFQKNANRQWEFTF